MNSHYIPRLILKQFAFNKKINIYNLNSKDFITIKLKHAFSKENLYDEDLVEERNFIYPVMVFQKGKKYYPRKSFIFSPILLEKKPPLFQKYLKDSKNQKEPFQ